MFKIPNLKKFKKKHKIYNTLKIGKKSNTSLLYGTFGIKLLENTRITPKQLEATRRIFSKIIKKTTGKIWIRVSLTQPLTKKPNEMRMGKGKGIIQYWITTVKRGTILFEITGVSFKIAKFLLLIAQTKLPAKSKLIFSRLY